jgi:DNA invertase Pin-like site-specific DNA recombinase
MKRLLIYVRPGVDESPEQELASVEVVRARLRAEGYVEAPVYEDGPAQAGVAFGCRKAGMRLGIDLERSDAVLIPRTARAFRNLQDMARTLALWAGSGVRFILADLAIDSCAVGAEAVACLLGKLVAAGKEMRGETVANAIRSRRCQGRPFRQAPYGFRLTGRRGRRKLAANPEQRRVGRLILEWRLQGYTWEAIQVALIRRGLRPNGRELSYGSIRRWCVAEARLQALEARRARGPQEQVEVECGEPSAARGRPDVATEFVSSPDGLKKGR